MGASKSGGGRTDAGPNQTTAYKKDVGMINEKGKQVSKNAFRNRGKDSVDRFKTPATMILGPALKANSVYNRDFFTDKVLTSTKGMKNFGYSKKEFSKLSASKQESIYKQYSRDRLSGKTDAYGGDYIRKDDRSSNQTILRKTAGGQTIRTTAPTEAEVSQSAAANAEAYDSRKTKKRGRSMTRFTSSKGVIDNKLTLGKPSLLGS